LDSSLGGRSGRGDGFNGNGHLAMDRVTRMRKIGVDHNKLCQTEVNEEDGRAHRGGISLNHEVIWLDVAINKVLKCSNLTVESWACERAFSKPFFLNQYHEHTIWEAYKNTFLLLNSGLLIKSSSGLPTYSRMMTSCQPSLPYQSTGEVPGLPVMLVDTLYL